MNTNQNTDHSTDPSTRTIVITGATGSTGSILAHLLLTRGERVRAVVRDPERARTRLDPRIELAVGDFADPSSLRPALAEAEAVYLACGNVPQQVEYECSVIDEAVQAGVQRIVKLSARGAELGSRVAYWHWHAQIEQHLHASGIASVRLQPSFAMMNLLAAADPVRDQGMIFAPAAAARISMIHPADVAAVAAVSLVPGHEGSTHVLTGPQAIGYAEVAADLSAVAGRHVSYVDIPPTAARAAMVEAGLPRFAADQIVAVFDALRHGAQAQTTATVESVTGHTARPLAAFAREHAEVYAGARVESLSA